MKKMTTIEYNHNERIFRVEIKDENIGGLCSVKLYEKMPKRKIFKWDFLCYYVYDIDEYNSLFEIATKVVERWIAHEELKTARNKKWSEVQTSS